MAKRRAVDDLAQLKGKAKKLGIPAHKVVRLDLPWCSGADAWEWYRLLGEFLEEHKPERASVEITLDGYDGYVDDVYVDIIKDKTEEELRTDVRAAEDAEAARLKKIEDKERQEYERLQAKFGNKK